jgi:hypothetical protein
MKLAEIARTLEATVITGADRLDLDILRCGASDLMSDILAGVADGSLLLTGLATLQTVRTASIAGIGAVGSPHIDFCYTHRVDGKEFVMDTRSLKTELAGLSLSDPVVWRRVSDELRRALSELTAGARLPAPTEDADA